MAKSVKYSVFETNWGYFALAGRDNCLIRTVLPVKSRRLAETILLTCLPQPDKALRQSKLFHKLQASIKSYYKGNYVDFSQNIPLDMTTLSEFAQKLFCSLRAITFGRIITYSQLASKAGVPNAQRAAGRVLSKNPLPLIIPCHRVIRSDGQPGGFSAQGGPKTKIKMLNLEKTALTVFKTKY